MRVSIKIRRTEWTFRPLSLVIEGPKRMLIIAPFSRERRFSWNSPGVRRRKHKRIERKMANFFAERLAFHQERIAQVGHLGLEEHTIYFSKDPDGPICLDDPKVEEGNNWSEKGKYLTPRFKK
jgi:hypothetical protein